MLNIRLKGHHQNEMYANKLTLKQLPTTSSSEILKDDNYNENLDLFAKMVTSDYKSQQLTNSVSEKQTNTSFSLVDLGEFGGMQLKVTNVEKLTKVSIDVTTDEEYRPDGVIKNIEITETTTTTYIPALNYNSSNGTFAISLSPKDGKSSSSTTYSVGSKRNISPTIGKEVVNALNKMGDVIRSVDLKDVMGASPFSK